MCWCSPRKSHHPLVRRLETYPVVMLIAWMADAPIDAPATAVCHRYPHPFLSPPPSNSSSSHRQLAIPVLVVQCVHVYRGEENHRCNGRGFDRNRLAAAQSLVAGTVVVEAFAHAGGGAVENYVEERTKSCCRSDEGEPGSTPAQLVLPWWLSRSRFLPRQLAAPR